jgi:predicted nucleic acid-binding protein
LKLIVADTGPLNYLIQVDGIGAMPEVFPRVILPVGVVAELRHPGAPQAVRDWSRSMPSWVEVVSLRENLSGEFRGLSDTDLQVLTWGSNLSATVLVDDLAAREAARRLGLPVLGTLGFLELAAAKGLMKLPEMLDRLRRTNMHLSDHLVDDALRRDRERRAKET